jgi:hypothetical protein
LFNKEACSKDNFTKNLFSPKTYFSSDNGFLSYLVDSTANPAIFYPALACPQKAM